MTRVMIRAVDQIVHSDSLLFCPLASISLSSILDLVSNLRSTFARSTCYATRESVKRTCIRRSSFFPPFRFLHVYVCVNINIFVALALALSSSARVSSRSISLSLSLTHSHSPNLSLPFSLSLSLPRLSARVVKKRIPASPHSHPRSSPSRASAEFFLRFPSLAD